MSESDDRLLIRVAEVTSTNDELARLAAAGAVEGTALAARRQTSGRGRHGRSWQTLPGEHVLVSVLHRSRLPLGQLSGLTLDVGVAVAEVLAGLGIATQLKWPNDILIDGMKVGGILCEVVDGAVVVGLGLNVQATELPPELPLATTLAASGSTLDGEALLVPLVTAIRAACAAYEGRGAPDIAGWQTRSVSLGRRVRLVPDGRVGRVVGVATDGALLVHWDGANEAERLVAGELETLEEGQTVR